MQAYSIVLSCSRNISPSEEAEFVELLLNSRRDLGTTVSLIAEDFTTGGDEAVDEAQRTSGVVGEASLNRVEPIQDILVTR